MNIKRKSNFKNISSDYQYFENWVKQLEKQNQRVYERFEVFTELGKTHVWGWNTGETEAETLVIFPGARTTSLIWDFDRGLDQLRGLRIFMVETNGLPNLSDGSTPNIRSVDYGNWAGAVLEQLGITNAFVAGASFGGLICMKLGMVHPEKIKAAFLLNPGCLQSFSLHWKNLYYNILPIIKPTERNVQKFLNEAIFCKPHHQLSPAAEKLLIDYEVFAISRYTDRTQKPYYMSEELASVHVDTYLLVGDRDLLFPYKHSIANAQKHLKKLKDVKVFNNVGHGIETYSYAMQYIGEKICEYKIKSAIVL
jgi:pimeloyl-ACP methyl ester carboxylesterase